MTEKRFYIYRHIKKSNGSVFYIGKGTGKRQYSKNKRNKYWENIVKKNGYESEIIIDNLTSKQALSKEIEFIKMYKSLGFCEANLTLGGEGLLSYRHSEATKEKIGNAHRGRKTVGRPHTAESIDKIRHSKIGKKRTDAQKNNMRVAQLAGNNWQRGKPSPRRKKVYCVELKRIFNCAKDASTELLINAKSISMVCNGRHKRAGGYTFVHLK